MFSLGTALLAIVALAGCASPSGKSAVRVREENQYIQLRHVQDTSQPVNLKKGDAVAMACAKCKTVLYHPIATSTTWFHEPWVRPGSLGYWARKQHRQAYENWARRHDCPGCRSTITVTGSWLNQKETVNHTCSACGDESVYCCATMKDAPPTEGMERK